MLEINGTTVRQVRGDSVDITIDVRERDGSAYVMRDGDSVRFALKRNLADRDAVLLKDCSNLRLIIEPQDTHELPFGVYVYDIELTKADGTIDTIIPASRWFLLEEVY